MLLQSRHTNTTHTFSIARYSIKLLSITSSPESMINILITPLFLCKRCRLARHHIIEEFYSIIRRTLLLENKEDRGSQKTNKKRPTYVLRLQKICKSYGFNNKYVLFNLMYILYHISTFKTSPEILINC